MAVPCPLMRFWRQLQITQSGLRRGENYQLTIEFEQGHIFGAIDDGFGARRRHFGWE
jgi:hypothetical protein